VLASSLFSIFFLGGVTRREALVVLTSNLQLILGGVFVWAFLTTFTQMADDIRRVDR
jgi:hypothetical protein